VSKSAAKSKTAKQMFDDDDEDDFKPPAPVAKAAQDAPAKV
jgi:hypothetical protein